MESICLHKSPSQNMEEFEMFVKNLELNLEFIFNKNPYLTVLVTLMLNHITGINAIKPNLWVKTWDHDFSLMTYSNK